MANVRNRLARILGLCSLLLVAAPTHAILSPVGIAIVPPLQFPSSEVGIVGVRVNALIGNHRNVYGLDAGLVNVTGVKFIGIQVGGLVNWNKGVSTVVGLQAAGLGNFNVNHSYTLGVMVAAGINSNVAESTVVGLQIAGIANHAPHTSVWGAQIGLYNSARIVRGFQIGVINMADDLRGLQIGLVNIHRNGLFRICPVINFGF